MKKVIKSVKGALHAERYSWGVLAGVLAIILIVAAWHEAFG